MTLTHPFLRSSSAKLAWAQRHRQALQANILGVQSDMANGAPLRADLDPDTGNHVRTIKAMPDYSEFRDNVSLGIGDVVGCARAALDHAVWHIVSDHVGGESNVQHPRTMAFPIYPGVTSLEKSATGKAVEPQISPPCWNIIKQAQTNQPYPGAGGPSQAWGRWPDLEHPFALMQKLSNDDKHRLIPVVLLQSGQRSDPPDWPPVDPDNWIDIDHAVAVYGKRMELGVEVVSERLLGAEPHIDDAGYVTPTPCLPGGSRVIVELKRIVDMVEFVLGEFQRVLPPPPIAL